MTDSSSLRPADPTETPREFPAQTPEETPTAEVARPAPPTHVGTVVTPPERAMPGSALRCQDPTPTMKIGEVSERLGLSLRSIRYYEEEGLVTPAGRTSGGFRLYCEHDVQRLLLIMQMKPLDFTLEQMRQVLSDLDIWQMTSPGDPRRVDVEERLIRLRAEIDDRYASARQRLQIASMFREHLAHELDGPFPDVSAAEGPAPATGSDAS